MLPKTAKDRKYEIKIKESKVVPKKAQKVLVTLYKWSLALVVGFLILFPLWWIFV